MNTRSGHSKRILMISYHTCPLASEEGKETGGMNVYVLELSKQLATMGYQVDAVTRSTDAKSKRIVQVSPGFRLFHLAAGPEMPINKKKLTVYIPQFTDAVIRMMRRENITYDIIHAHYYQSGLIALGLERKTGQQVPLVMTFHTLALMKNLVARSAAEQESQTRIDAELKLAQTADRIIAPSENDAQYLMYLYNTPEDKIRLIAPGVNTGLFRPMDKSEAKHHIGAAKSDRIILFVGRIEPLKGIDEIMYAMKILRGKSPDLDLCLAIVGGDISQHRKRSRTMKKLEEVRRTLGITANVTFTGQQPQHELPFYYNAADIVVMPSHYESFGMAAAEAMACGTPVITTNVTGISYLLDGKRSAVISSVNNPLLLASRISKLLTDTETYRTVSRNMRENVRDLTWDRVAREMSAVYEEPKETSDYDTP